MEKEVRKYKICRDNIEQGIVSGYAIRFDESSQDIGFYEVIHRGAITQEIIDNSDVYALFNHDENKVLARSRYGVGSLTLELRDDGLFYTFQLPNTEIGNELREHIKRGEITTSSFAFTLADDPNADSWNYDGGVAKRDIYHIGKLYDVSPVFEAAYPTTSCDARKKLEKLDSLEKLFENL